jgi:hypothetical protein
MLKLRELIKKVRLCKTAEEERSVINKESAEIRNMGKVKILTEINKIGTIRLTKEQKSRKVRIHAHVRVSYGFYSNDLRKFISQQQIHRQKNSLRCTLRIDGRKIRSASSYFTYY